MRNIAECKKCGEVIESTHIDDTQVCGCWRESNGEDGFFIKGGESYRLSGGEVDYIIWHSEMARK